jgi:hypothetical protein
MLGLRDSHNHTGSTSNLIRLLLANLPAELSFRTMGLAASIVPVTITTQPAELKLVHAQPICVERER